MTNLIEMYDLAGDWIFLGDHQQRVARLAQFNSERSRGIVHTPEWVAFMAEEQAWFDRGASNHERKP